MTALATSPITQEFNTRAALSDAFNSLKDGAAREMRERLPRTFDMSEGDAKIFSSLITENLERLQLGLERKEFVIASLHGLPQLQAVIQKLAQNDANAARFSEFGKAIESLGINPDAFYALVVFGFHRGQAGFIGGHRISHEGLISKTLRQTDSSVVTPAKLVDTLSRLVKLQVVTLKESGEGAGYSVNPHYSTEAGLGIGPIIDFCHSQREWIITTLGHKIHAGFSGGEADSRPQARPAGVQARVINPILQKFESIYSAMQRSEPVNVPDLLSAAAQLPRQLPGIKRCEERIAIALTGIVSNSHIQQLPTNQRELLRDALTAVMVCNSAAIKPLASAFELKNAGMNFVTLGALLRYCEGNAKSPADTVALKVAIRCIQDATREARFASFRRDLNERIDILIDDCPNFARLWLECKSGTR